MAVPKTPTMNPGSHLQKGGRGTTWWEQRKEWEEEREKKSGGKERVGRRENEVREGGTVIGKWDEGNCHRAGNRRNRRRKIIIALA